MNYTSEVKESEGKPDRNIEVSSRNTTRCLGISANTENDKSYFIHYNLIKLIPKDDTLTLPVIYKVVASIHDPIGFLQFFTCTGRQIHRNYSSQRRQIQQNAGTPKFENSTAMIRSKKKYKRGFLAYGNFCWSTCLLHPI